VEWALDNTFKDAKIEFEDLDGLSWPERPAPLQAIPDSPSLEPLFGPGKSSIPVTIYETDWSSVTSSPARCQCGFNRSPCQLHPRKLSRSRRTSEINLPQRADVSDPFAFVPIPSGREEESDLQRTAQFGTTIARPLSVRQVESRSRPFKTLELPPEEDLCSPIAPPPGLPLPLLGFQSLRGVPFPTRV